MTTRQFTRCACGKIKSRNANECGACYNRRRVLRIAEATAIVRTGACPDCGSKLRRNNALAGWWQCEQFGTEQNRARPDAPACSFQTFTV